MKGLLAAFAMISALILLYGCVSEQANKDQGAGNGAQNAAATADKVIFTAPPQLPDGKVGTHYE